MKPKLLIFFFILFYFMTSAQHVVNKNQHQIDSLLSKLYRNDEPGISMAIFQKGKVIFKKSYGITDMESKTKLDSKTNFNIGSLTKQFTAFAILQLAEKKKVSLDDHIGKFLPELNKKIANLITIKELLTHSSGIIDHYDLAAKDIKHGTMYDVLNAVKNTDSTYFSPGTQYRYSNTAYNLLSIIIERVSGMSYAEYLRKNIFEPTGMKNTVVWNEKAKIKNEATGYEYGKPTNSFKESGADENIFFSTEGDGGIYTSVDDYLKWFEALQKGNQFHKKIIAEARASHFLIDQEKHVSYGYGWFVEENTSPVKVYHSGSNGGFRAYSFSIPQENFLIVIFSNRTGVDLEKLVKEIYSLLYSEGK